MKWYKRDPAAALEGMLGLTIEERGAYNAVIDLIYARAPRGGVTDQLVCKALGCRPQVWRRLKASLMEKGKIWENPPGNLLANRVVSEVVSAEFRTQNMARLSHVSALKRNEINALADRVWQKRDAPATVGTPRLSKKESFLLPREAKEAKQDNPARSLASALPVGALTREPDSEPAEPERSSDKKPEDMTLAEINAIRYGRK